MALSSSCQKISVFDYILDPDTPILIIPGCARYQKIAKAKTVNLRYFTSNSDPFEGGKQPFVYKSEQMALFEK